MADDVLDIISKFAGAGVRIPENERGYHAVKFPKGTPGEADKILEETAEFLDAHLRGKKIMALVELSDLVGAIEAYLEREYGDKVVLADILAMSSLTRQSFRVGERS